MDDSSNERSKLDECTERRRGKKGVDDQCTLERLAADTQAVGSIDDGDEE